MLCSRSISYIYTIGSYIIKPVTQIKDSGVIYTSNLNFNLHICDVVEKSYRMLGFMRRILKPFNDNAVYTSL